MVREATSGPWKPVFYLLENTGFRTWLVNARAVKHLPGRPKTDELGAVWLCKVAERQMPRPSFVPPPTIRALRDLTRYRAGLITVRTAEKQRVEKLLEDAQSKLPVAASDISGVSGRDMPAALAAGERDPKVLAQLARRPNPSPPRTVPPDILPIPGTGSLEHLEENLAGAPGGEHRRRSPPER